MGNATTGGDRKPAQWRLRSNKKGENWMVGTIF
jgi:hypothetical protein